MPSYNKLSVMPILSALQVKYVLNLLKDAIGVIVSKVKRRPPSYHRYSIYSLVTHNAKVTKHQKKL